MPEDNNAERWEPQQTIYRLKNAIETNNIEIVQSIVNHFNRLNDNDKKQHSGTILNALDRAVLFYHDQIVQTLLDVGIDLDNPRMEKALKRILDNKSRQLHPSYRGRAQHIAELLSYKLAKQKGTTTNQQALTTDDCTLALPQAIREPLKPLGHQWCFTLMAALYRHGIDKKIGAGACHDVGTMVLACALARDNTVLDRTFRRAHRTGYTTEGHAKATAILRNHTLFPHRVMGGAISAGLPMTISNRDASSACMQLCNTKQAVSATNNLIAALTRPIDGQQPTVMPKKNLRSLNLMLEHMDPQDKENLVDRLSAQQIRTLQVVASEGAFRDYPNIRQFAQSLNQPRYGLGADAANNIASIAETTL